MARDRDGLLSEKHYDDDASIVASDPNSGSDTEGDIGAEPVTDHDRDVLEENEEQERLLRKPGRFQAARDALRLHKGSKDGGSGSTRQRSRSKRSRRGRETSDMIFEMEGGFKDTSSQSSLDAFDLDGTNWEGKPPRQPRRGRLALIHVAIIGLFVALVFGAYKASRKHTLSPTAHRLAKLNNGTHIFRPTTILISLDGFRADFLNRNITPALNAFIASGVSPKFMLPSFPSVTFPNHFTLVTGLYPESHGIVSNQFWDPEFEEEFYYTDLSVSMQPKWWTAEPLWVTAEHQKVRSAIHMWPGSEAHIPDVNPSYLDKYNGSEALPRKVERLLHWLDLPGDDDDADTDAERRPQFIAAYVPNVDADGHKYGPNSTEIRATIADVDSMLTMLVEGLYARNLTEIVNIVIVSDHGMATTSTERLIQLDDIMDVSLIDHIDGWPLRGLRLKDPERDLASLYKHLSDEAEISGSFEVYTLETMPERYHFSNNPRIAELWIVPKTGWAVVTKENFDVADALRTGKDYSPKGLHGYDHEHPLMRAIFVARGPAFPHAANSRLPIFQNIEVYNIVCDSLGIAPHPNNGTLRLPLKPEGLHSDPGQPELETPADPGDDVEGKEPEAVHDNDSDAADDAADAGAGNEPSEEDDDEAAPDRGKGKWWEFLHNQLQKAKEWAKEFVQSIKGNKKGAGDPPV
ncbi:ectonucleotide pyrophosphatase/phosphodiesterase family member 1/3 [Capronia coronata CBS 617.96]|uniref:Ectonucleotide pyrophosphatase/phosphodiesterase family member 1/3 n=1 Tax=Capronia coronata CBS 617.96 TaxID=1182541 RepID=W9XXN5_9EURO|nr:ectonucleotide pyrophosphatase/phosphodiesterase family member 1/3 [Capronia coronata CBS 617.96]EXJ81741.1 ectonucleotide pyrophosphatase/phosphodiesterase family member 1/3 [Capronia coronata CBS 617.96]